MNSIRNLTQTLVCLIVTILFTGCSEDTPTPYQPLPDFHPPEIEWLAPQSGAELSGIVELSFSVCDGESGIDRISVYLNGFSPDAWQLTACPDSVYSISWDTRDMDDDVYILEVRAWDDEGNLGISPSLMVRINNDVDPPPEDLIPPVVAWVNPLPNSIVSDTVELCFQVMDNIGVDSVRVYKNGYSPPEFYVPGHDEIDYRLLWNTASDSDGIYVLEIRAWDSSGNMGGGTALLVQVVNNPSRPEDQMPPDVWWTSPEPGSTLTDSVLLSFRVIEENTVDQIRLYKNGITQDDLHIPINPEGEYEFWWDTRNDSDGVFIWQIRAWDESGNIGDSPSLLLRVKNNPEPPEDDRTPPVITWLSPDPGDTLEGAVHLRFQVMDVSQLDSVQVYLNGQKWQNFQYMGNFYDGDVTWLTNEWSDGNYIIQVKAFDTYGNIGLSEVAWFSIWNNRPRVIWVPDDFETIQDAIRDSENGDTVRVREGVYREWLQMFDKNIWLESESGPENTIIDLTGAWTFWVVGGQDTTSGIRGFTIMNNLEDFCNGINLSGAHPKIVNNIFTGPNLSCVWTGQTESNIRNNLMINVSIGAQIAHSWGDFSNNMIVHTSRWGFWNAAGHGQLIVPDYNLFWNVEELFGGSPFGWGEHNIDDQEPIFIIGSYRLQEGSPGIDQGRPDLLDPDGSRSDIGVYGGPYAYPIN